MDEVLKTGIFATEEETADFLARYKEMASTPLIFPNGLSSAQAIDNMWEQFKDSIDELALSHGLPQLGKIDGLINHYGLLGTGEFTTLKSEEL